MPFRPHTYIRVLSLRSIGSSNSPVVNKLVLNIVLGTIAAWRFHAKWISGNENGSTAGSGFQNNHGITDLF